MPQSGGPPRVSPEPVVASLPPDAQLGAVAVTTEEKLLVLLVQCRAGITVDLQASFIAIVLCDGDTFLGSTWAEAVDRAFDHQKEKTQ